MATAASKRKQEKRRQVKRLAIGHLGGKCEKCGYRKCERALQFHHHDPAGKEFSLAGRSAWNKGLITELEKCILLCSNCHAEVHQAWIDGDKEIDQRILAEREKA